jgi:hypothetical protein
MAGKVIKPALGKATGAVDDHDGLVVERIMRIGNALIRPRRSSEPPILLSRTMISGRRQPRFGNYLLDTALIISYTSVYK